MTAGLLRGRMVIVIWTPRRDTRHVISMSKANDVSMRSTPTQPSRLSRLVAVPVEWDIGPALGVTGKWSSKIAFAR